VRNLNNYEFQFHTNRQRSSYISRLFKHHNHETVVLAFDKERGVVIESDQYEIGYYRADWRFEDTNQWTRISGKIEL
jgi:hypothetical protein